jgi:hypothetical protein
MRAAWAQGRNYDVDLLTISLATPGFILGEAILGTSLLGDRGTDVPFDPDFTSIQIDEPTTVEDGLFVHREVATCKLTATLPEMIELRGRWLTLAYDGVQLFAGRVARAEWTETVDVARDFLPGNTSTKTYRVSLAASNGEEVLAGSAAQITGAGWETASQSREELIENLTGYPVLRVPGSDDLPLDMSNQGWDVEDPSYASIAYEPGERQSLLDALRMQAKVGGDVVIYQPRADDQVILQKVNKWLSNSIGTKQDTALTFTDAAITSPTTDPGDDFLTTDKRVSYTERQVSEDPALFTNSVVLKFTWFGTDDGSGNPYEFTFGPYRANDANPQDVEVDLGKINLNVAYNAAWAYRFARAVVQTLPIKANSAPYTSSLDGPLQSTKQLEGTVPGMAMLEHDGESERVAILGRTHTITPDRWMVSYECGPGHLLTRTSDREPAPGIRGTTSIPGDFGAPITWHWTVPDLPTDVTFYERIIKNPGQWYTSDQSSYDQTVDRGPQVSGAARSFSPAGGVSGTSYAVQYTSNPAPGTDNPNDLWREGQVLWLGTQP